MHARQIVVLVGLLLVTVAASAAPARRGGRLRPVITDAEAGQAGPMLDPPGPPQPHVHHFVAGHPPGENHTTYADPYVRAGGVIPVSVMTLYELDHCDGAGQCGLWRCLEHDAPCCYHGVRVVGWSDGGAGGTFGHQMPDGSFVEVVDPADVTHYQAGENPQVVTIIAQLDDLPGQEYDRQPLADDEPSWSTVPARVTVWEVTISRPNVRPAHDLSLEFVVRIRPETDHLDQSMARGMSFTLNGVSSEPGYCLNATSDLQDWRATTGDDNDEKIDPTANPGMMLMDGQTTYAWGMVMAPATDRTLTVRCLDYGAWGTVQAQLMSGFGGAPGPAARLDTSSVWEPVYGAAFPVDEDGTRIWDGWAFDGDPYFDGEWMPPGEGVDGDGLTLYEEYRSVIESGVHVDDLDPVTWKDVWIRDEDGVGIGCFGDLGYIVHAGLRADEVVMLTKLPGQQGEYQVALLKTYADYTAYIPVFAIRLSISENDEPLTHGCVWAGAWSELSGSVLAWGNASNIAHHIGHELGHAVCLAPGPGGHGHNPEKGCTMDDTVHVGQQSPTAYCQELGGDGFICHLWHRLLP